MDFIGFTHSQNPVEMKGEDVSNHDELMSNFFAQVRRHFCFLHGASRLRLPDYLWLGSINVSQARRAGHGQD